MASLRPKLEIDGCLFTHIEPWLNPEELSDLWYFDGTPDEHGNFERIFNSVSNRLIFAGHDHKWLLVNPDGVEDWQCLTTIRLDKGRKFVVVGALCDGQFAVFDTETCDLYPF